MSPSMAKEIEMPDITTMPDSLAIPDTLTASDALVGMPAETLDLLTTSMRLDLLDYYRADSIYRVQNTLGGQSHLLRPLTQEYLKVRLTSASTLTIKILPYRNSRIAVTSHTIGDTITAADSEIRFYDRDMRELKRDKFIKLATIEDFLKLDGVGRKTRKELTDLIPFPTIEYTLFPDSGELHAVLTVGEYLSKEALDKITPYLRRDRVYIWTGRKYEIQN